MAGPTVKEILLAWKIDLTDAKAAISSLEQRMDQLFSKQQAQAQAGQTQIKQQGALYKSQVVDPAIEASVKLQSQLAREKLSADAVRQARQGVVDMLKQESGVMSQKQGMSAQELAALKRVTSELEKQQRLQATRGIGGGGRFGGGQGGAGGPNQPPGGFLGGMLGAVGSKLAGTITAANLATQALDKALQLAAESFHKMVLEGDKLVNVQNLFERLSQRAGTAPEEFLNKLRVATHGLITDTQLMTSANKIFMQNLPLTSKQVADLTSNVVNLALAQGKDGVEALEALNHGLASGRMNMIAYQLGLSKNIQFELAETNQLPMNVRLLTQYMIINKAVADQLKVTGPAVETLTDHFKRLETATANFTDRIATMTAKASEGGGLSKLLDSITSFFNDFSNAAAGADLFGASLNAVASAGNAVLMVLKALVKVPLDIIFGSFSAASTTTAARFTTFKGVLISFAQVLTLVASGVQLLTQGLGFLVKEIDIFFTAHETTLKGLWARMKDEYNAFHQGVLDGNAELLNQLQDMQDDLDGKAKASKDKKNIAPPGEDEEDLRAQERTAKLRKEVEIAEAKEKLQTIKSGLQLQEMMEDEAYKNGLLSLQDYLAKKMALRREAAKEEIAVIETERAAELADMNLAARITEKYYDQFKKQAADIKKQGKQPNQTQDEFDQQLATAQKGVKEYQQALNDPALQRKLINVRKDTEENAITEGLAKEQVESNEKQDADIIAARRKRVQTLLEIEKGGVAQEKALLENNFKEGVVTAQQYLDARINLIGREREATEKAAYDEYVAAGKSDTAKEALAQKYAQAELQAEKETTALLDNEYQTREKATRQFYDNREALVKGQLDYEKELEGIRGPGASEAGQIPILQTLLSLERQRLAEQQAQLSSMHEINDDWFKQQEIVQKTQLEVLKYEEAIVKSHNEMGQMAEMAKELQTGFASFDLRGRIGTRFKDMASALGDASSRMEAFQKINEQVRAAALAKTTGVKPVDWTDPHSVTQALGQATTGVAAQFQNNLIPASQRLAEIFDKIAAAITSASDQQQGGGTGSGASGISGLIPHMAEGGSVLGSGLAVVHAGEQVIPAGVTTALLALESVVRRITSAFSTMAEHVTKVAQPSGAAEPSPSLPRQQTTPSGFMASGVQPTGQPSALQNFLGLPSGSFTDSLKASFAQSTLGTLIGFKGPSAVTGTPSSVLGDTSAANALQLSGPATAANPQGTLSASDKYSLGQSVRSAASSTGQGAVDNATLNVSGLGGASAQTTQSVDQLGASTDATSAAQGGAASGLSAGVGAMTQGLQAVGGLMSAIQGQGGPLKAGLTGAASGAQLGGMVGGPIGAAIGGIAGLITGIFAGAAEAATQRMATNLSAEFTTAVNSIKGGQQTLVGGIAQVQALMNTTVSSLSGAKGGKDELKALLPAMQQQMTALLQQQQQVLQGFRQQLEVLNAPVQYGDSLNQIQQIISAYQQYIQAGGSVADANEYLQQSFANLAQQGIQQLNQDEQDAVNNALNYNNMLLQRQNLIQSTNEQIHNIMSQGVAVQQMPEGVSKAEQIEQVSQNAQIQLDQLNEQISVSDHELQNQQTIFNLATTRIGLENQLVVLQNQQTDLQTKQVEALGNVVSSLSTALPTSMPAALQELGLGAAYVAPTAGEAPTPPVKTGIQSVDLSNEMAYQQALAYYNAQVNLPVGYINPSGTPSASVQTGTANQIYTGIPGTVPTTTTVPTVFGSSSATGNLTQQQLQQLINETQVGQPIGGAAPPYTGGTIGTGITGSPNLNPNGLPTSDTSGLTVGGAQVDTISTASGQAMLVTVAGNALPVPIIGGPQPIGPTGPGGGPGSPGSPTSPTSPTSTTYGNAPAPVGFNLQAPTPLPTNIDIPTTVQTGPGTTQVVGIVGTPASVAYAGGAVVPPTPPPPPQVFAGGSPGGPVKAGPRVTVAPLPASLTLYGTDSNGSPVYVDPNGNLYDASGQFLGTVGVSASSATSAAIYQQMVSSTAPLSTNVAARTTSAAILSPDTSIPTIGNTPINVSAGLSPVTASTAPVTVGGTAPSPLLPVDVTTTAPATTNYGAMESNLFSTLSSIPVPQPGFQNLGAMMVYSVAIKLQNLVDSVTSGATKPGDALMQLSQLQASPIVSLANNAALNSSFTQAQSLFQAMLASGTAGIQAPTMPVGPTQPIQAPTMPIGPSQPVSNMPLGTQIGPNMWTSGLQPSTMPIGPSTPVPFSAADTSPTNTAMAQINAQLTATMQRASIEQNINQLSNTRVTAETSLVSLKMTEISADMARVNAWNALLSRYSNTQAAGSNLESQFNSLYNNRARQGLSGFYGEIANAT